MLKQINTVESTETTKETEAYSDVNFVTRPKTRLTNHVLKKILNQGVADQADKRIQSISSNKNTQITDIVGKRSINKKAKSQIKKNLWTQSKVFLFLVLQYSESLSRYKVRIIKKKNSWFQSWSKMRPLKIFLGKCHKHINFREKHIRPFFLKFAYEKHIKFFFFQKKTQKHIKYKLIGKVKK